MTFEELPYVYRGHAVDKGWSEDQAIAYWTQGEEYREYATGCLLRKMAHGFSQDDIYVVTTVDDLLDTMRGSRVSLS